METRTLGLFSQCWCCRLRTRALHLIKEPVGACTVGTTVNCEVNIERRRWEGRIGACRRARGRDHRVLVLASARVLVGVDHADLVLIYARVKFCGY